MDQTQNTASAQTSLPLAPAPAPAPAAAAAPAVQAQASAPAAPEAPKAAPVSDAASKAELSRLQSQLADMQKQLQAADSFKEKLGQALGFAGQKVDPLEAATQQVKASTERIALLESRVKQAALVDALRQHASDAHDAKDLLGFLPQESLVVDLSTGALANEEAFKSVLAQVRASKGYLFKPAAPQGQQAAPVVQQPAPNFAPPSPTGAPAANGKQVFGNGGFGVFDFSRVG